MPVRLFPYNRVDNTPAGCYTLQKETTGTNARPINGKKEFNMKIGTSVEQFIGNTPLVELGNIEKSWVLRRTFLQSWNISIRRDRSRTAWQNSL